MTSLILIESLIFEITDFHWYVVLTFGKTTEAVAVKCRLVDKYVRAAIIRSNEAIPLLTVPPLTSTGGLLHRYAMIISKK